MGGGAFGPFGEQKLQIFKSWKFWIYVCINAAEKHSERPCYGIWLKFVDFWPAWRTNLLNVPLVYAHGRILHTQSAPSHSIEWQYVSVWLRLAGSTTQPHGRS